MNTFRACISTGARGVWYPRIFLGLTAWHPRILADQLSLSKPGGQIMPTILLLGTRTSKILTQTLSPSRLVFSGKSKRVKKQSQYSDPFPLSHFSVKVKKQILVIPRPLCTGMEILAWFLVVGKYYSHT